MKRILAVLLSLTVLLVAGCSTGARGDERAINAVLSSPQLREQVPVWEQFPKTPGKQAGKFQPGGTGTKEVPATFESMAARTSQGYHVSFALLWVEGGEKRYTVIFDVTNDGEAKYVGNEGTAPPLYQK